MQEYKRKSEVIMWIDTETTDLDGPKYPLVETANGYLQSQQTGDLLQVGIILTTMDLIELGEFEISVCPTALAHGHIDAINMANDSGVMALALSADDKAHAEVKIIEWIESIIGHYKERPQIIFANCNAKFDTNWLAAQMPTLSKMFYYRNICVSAIEMALRTLDPEFRSLVDKDYGHTALADAREALEHFRATQAILKYGMDSWNGCKLKISDGIPIYDNCGSIFEKYSDYMAGTDKFGRVQLHRNYPMQISSSTDAPTHVAVKAPIKVTITSQVIAATVTAAIALITAWAVSHFS